MSSLYEANELQVLEPLLVAIVSDIWNYFVVFLCTHSSFPCPYINVVTRIGLYIPGGVGQVTCSVGA